jgi:hypothetical protein
VAAAGIITKTTNDAAQYPALSGRSGDDRGARFVFKDAALFIIRQSG